MRSRPTSENSPARLGEACRVAVAAPSLSPADASVGAHRGGQAPDDQTPDDQTPDDQTEVIRFLSRPESHGGGTAVERIDTHISIVFLIGDKAYKLKRAARFPYLDFSSAARRRRFCEAEVEINRRTAPDLYDGVVAVTRDRAGRLSLGGEGEPVDWLVAMRRFDQSCLLDRLAESGALGDAVMARLADTVAAFHAAAEPGPTSGAAAAMRRTVEGSLAEIARHGSAVFDDAAVERFAAGLGHALSHAQSILDRRAAEGRVRRCHGDLHLRNVYMDGDRPTPFDAIEFNDRIGVIDTMYDYAFLVMDLVHRDMAAAANTALNRYLQRTEDYDGLALLGLFLAARAAVRAHTTASAAERQTNAAAAERLRSEACGYLELGLQFLEPGMPRLVAIGGYSGSGKSTLARLLGPRLGGPAGAIVVRSDVVRKTIHGVAPEEKLPAEAYAEEVSRRVHDRMRAHAAEALGSGLPVIVDATFMDPAERARIAGLAAEVDAPFAGLWLEVPQAVMARRVETRGADASDANRAVLESQLGGDIGTLDWTRVDAGDSTHDTLAAALAALPERFGTDQGDRP